MSRPVDVLGVPTEHDGYSSPYCPEEPCTYCTGNASLRKNNGLLMTSWEWCQEMDTCAATVDWDEVFDQ